MRKHNDSYLVRNDIYGKTGGSGSIDAATFFDYLKVMLKEGTNITLDIDGTGKTITINSSTNTTDVQNIINQYLSAGSNIAINVVDGKLVISSTGGSGTDDHKVIASSTDIIPAELVHKVIGDGITVELVSTPDPTYGEQLKLKAIPEGIIKEAEFGVQPMQLCGIETAIDFNGVAPVFKQMFFMNYSTRIDTISLYCFQSGIVASGMRFFFADANNKVLATTYKITYVPQGWVEYPLYGALEWEGIKTLSLNKKQKYKFCAGMQVGAQDPKWLGTQTELITGSSGEEIGSADLNFYSGYTNCANLVGVKLTAGSRVEQAGRRIWFAGYMA